MKKLFAVLMVCTMLFALAATASASKIGDYRGEIPKVAEGEITVDGTLDDVYKYAFQTGITELYAAGTETGTYAKAYLMWTDGKMYVYVTVYDKEVITTTPDLQEATPYIVDSSEIFLDLGNERTLPLVLARVDYSGFPSYFVEGGDIDLRGAECDEYMQYAAKWTNDGYNIEMCVDLARYIETEEGYEIGLNLMVNEMTSQSASKRTAMIQMPSKNHAKDWDIDLYDYVKLGGMYDPNAEVTELVIDTKPVETEEPETEPVTTEEPETEPEETEEPETEPETTEETEKQDGETKPVITDDAEEASFPVVPVVIAAVVLVAIVVGIVLATKKKN